MNNKAEQIKVYVMIGTIVMLLVIFSGITYAFFSASNNKGSTSMVEVTNGQMTISYADGKSSLLVSKDIVPSNEIIIDKTFTLTGINTTSGLVMPYKVGLKYISTFSDDQIHYYVKEINRPNNSNVTAEYTGEANQTVQGNSSYSGYSHGTLKKGNKYTEMVTGKFFENTSNQTITFNLKIQFPDTGENQDSEKGKEINGKVVINYEQPKATTFVSDSWETIAAVVQDGQLDAYKVGDEKEVKIDDTNYTVRVANKTTPEECNGNDFSETACGFVIEFVDIVENRQMNSLLTNKGGWPATLMRIYANDTFFDKLPSDLQKVIIDTKVISGYGSTESVNHISTDKIYLLGAHEVWNDKLSYDTEYDYTRQLDYYAEKNVLTNLKNEYAKKLYGSLEANWWLRTPCNDSDTLFYDVLNAGSYYFRNSNTTYGFAPAFRIG